MKRVLVVEFGRMHGHVVYPECVLLLAAGYEVTVLIGASNPEILMLETLQDRIRLEKIECGGKRFCLLHKLFYHARQDYERVYFTTMELYEDIVLYLLFALLMPKPIAYVLHILKPSYGETWLQRLLYRLLYWRTERIYVLSENILSNARTILPAAMQPKLTYFSPVFFPEYLSPDQSVNNGDERIDILILGRLDLRRRSYKALCDVLPQLAASDLRHRVRIHLLGQFILYGFADFVQEFVCRAAEHDLLQKTIKLYSDSYMDFDQMAVYLRQADFLMPLIHADVQASMNYAQQIYPSVLMWSQAFAIPLISSRDFPVDAQLHPFTLWYDSDDIMTGLEAAVELYESPEYQQKRTDYRRHTDRLFKPSQENFIHAG
jgi:hypothetical protein